MTPIVALYARVSTRQQEQEATIESQLSQLLSYAQQQGYRIDPVHQYLDQAVSGAQLNRSGLNRLRDAIAAHAIELLLCAAPDRLARTLGLQLVLLAEFRRAGVTVVFLDHPQLGTDPQSQLLLQIQGAFAEYERDLSANACIAASSTACARVKCPPVPPRAITINAARQTAPPLGRCSRKLPRLCGRSLRGMLKPAGRCGTSKTN